LGVSPSVTEGGDEMHDVAMRRRIAALVIVNSPNFAQTAFSRKFGE
jgi:hypothetical protein